MKNLITKCVFVGLFVGGGVLSAAEAMPQRQQSYERNECPDSCDCGCKEGKPCTCEPGGFCGTEVQEGCTEHGVHCYGPSYCPGTCYEAEICNADGVWLPEDPVLFRPLIASPRQITYSVGWRFNDQALVKNVIDVSYGDSVAFYRWCDIGPWCGQLQIELEGALWAVFDPLHDSSPLVNADYYVGVPITYAFDNWAFRLRGYHISCHIGDEFLLNHPGFDRRNPSAEFLDFYVSTDYTDEIRLYAGVGIVLAQDESFRCGRSYYEAGMEIRMPRLGFINECSQVYGMPFFAADFLYQGGMQRDHINQTYVMGYEWGKLCGLQRKLRLFIEYHDGYSVEGQFCCLPTNYFSIRMSYGF